MRLKDQVAIITGTGAGIGRTAAIRFVREGARVVGCSRREEPAAETARLATAEGGEYLSIAGVDLSREEDVAMVVERTVERFGGIDLVYNNAVDARPGPLANTSVADFEYSVKMVLEMPWLMTKAALPYLTKSPTAAVLNTSSIHGAMLGTGEIGNGTFTPVYAAAKSALNRLTQLMAIEFAEAGIRVNSISPGIIETPAVAPVLGVGTDPRLRGWWEELSLARRIGTPDEVVNAAVFLLSTEASYITGTDLLVDGGWAASGGLGRPNAEMMEAVTAVFATDRT